MGNISDEFKKLMKKEVPDKKFLIPLMTWVSGSQSNIESVQKINEKIGLGNQNIYILELVYNTNINHFLRYPKVEKLKDDDLQLVRDLGTFFGWSHREFVKNIHVVDLESSKEEISNLFGYDKKTKRKLGIK